MCHSFEEIPVELAVDHMQCALFSEGSCHRIRRHHDSAQINHPGVFLGVGYFYSSPATCNAAVSSHKFNFII